MFTFSNPFNIYLKAGKRMISLVSGQGLPYRFFQFGNKACLLSYGFIKGCQ